MKYIYIMLCSFLFVACHEPSLTSAKHSSYLHKTDQKALLKGRIDSIVFNFDTSLYAYDLNSNGKKISFTHTNKLYNVGDEVYVELKNSKALFIYLAKKRTKPFLKTPNHKRTKSKQLIKVPQTQSISLE